ncbi:MAG: glycosyltransferase family 4 protein [Bacteroidota bacterium]|nr:glycosyltransferase family 4 protein [Bacteroidota bacterium]
MMRKTVLFLVNKDNVIYNFRRELAFKLIELGYRVVISCPYGKKLDFLTEKGAEWVDVKIDRRGTSVFKDLKLIKQYYTQIKLIKPDVVLCYTTKCSIYGGVVCKMLQIPYIVNNAGLIENEQGVLELIMRHLYKIGFKGAACMMYQNERERKYVNDIIGDDVHYRDIPGSGVNLSEFPFAEYPADDKEIVFNYVARIVDFKGIEELLAAAARIKPIYPNVHFVLYGDYDDDSYRARVKELEKKGIVEYGGIQLDMRPFIKKAHAVIHPSHYEGMTNVILEHAAMGRPAIASDIPGCREGIENGVTGYTFELKNVDSLVNKIEVFLSLSHGEKMEMGKAARAKMEKEFDRAFVTDIYVNEIKEILCQR